MPRQIRDWPKLEVHEFASALPMMPPPEFSALKEDIVANGLRERIVLFQGRILDGRHRFRACQELAKAKRLREPPQFDDFKGSDREARQFVASLNMFRRHLTKSQKAMVLVTAGYVSPPAKSGARRKYGTGRDAIMEVGKRFGINHVTLYKASFIHARDQKLAEKVVDGSLSVPAAEKIIRDREQQPSRQSEKALTAELISEMEQCRTLLLNTNNRLKGESGSKVGVGHAAALKQALRKLRELLEKTIAETNGSE